MNQAQSESRTPWRDYFPHCEPHQQILLCGVTRDEAEFIIETIRENDLRLSKSPYWRQTRPDGKGIIYQDREEGEPRWDIDSRAVGWLNGFCEGLRTAYQKFQKEV